MGRLRGRQKIVNGFISYCGTVRKEVSVLRQHLFWSGQREMGAKVK